MAKRARSPPKKKNAVEFGRFRSSKTLNLCSFVYSVPVVLYVIVIAGIIVAR